MKKFLLILILVAGLTKLTAQVVFCPPGAEWHYTFTNYFQQDISNEKIKYTRDSILGNDTVKLLQHRYFFKYNNTHLPGPGLTLIKQNGDTVFFRNVTTQNSWQVLYNFNAPKNSGWFNQLNLTAIIPTIISYSTLVDSIDQVSLNGYLLKRMFIRQTRYENNHTINYFGTITERIGCKTFLFNFDGRSETDADQADSVLCYNDNQFGLKQFTSKACTYNAHAGFSELGYNPNVNIYPNPSSNFVTIEFIVNSTANMKVQLFDLSGRQVITKANTLNLEKIEIDLSSLQNGIYFLKVFKEEKLLRVEKIIKK